MIPGGAPPEISMNVGNNAILDVRGFDGHLAVTDCDTNSSNADVSMARGHLVLYSSCIDGEVHATGICEFTDLSGVGCIVEDDTHNSGNVAGAVWTYTRA